MSIEEVKKIIFEQYLKNLIKQKDGKKYIKEVDFKKLKLNNLERKFALNILEENNIKMESEKIEQKDRPSLVRNYNYGEVLANDLESIDDPLIAEIEYDEEEIIEEDYTELEKFLEYEFIPNHMRRKVNKETGEVTYEPYIQLNHIVKLRLSELENKYIFKYLEDLNITVGGISPDLDADREIENYRYARTFKESQKPDYDPNFNNEKMIEEYKRTKDLQLKKDIINNNIKLVSWVAYKWSIITGINIHELESYGYEGLIKSVDNFDITKGYKFSTYAVSYIKGQIKKGIPKIEGYYKNDFFYSYICCKNIVEELNAETIEENPKLLKDIFDLMVQTKKINSRRYNDFISLINVCRPEHLEDIDTIEDTYDIEYEVDKKIDADVIDEVLQTLTPREERVIRLRFGLDDGVPKTLEETANIFNLSRERIRQIEAKALRKLRHPLRSNKLKSEEFKRK